ncbi:MAG: DPP IV N-terminal domain-containing protein [Planctomycetota bacterium]
MKSMRFTAAAAAAFSVLAGMAGAACGQDLLTTAERTDFRETSTYDDVMRFVEEIAERSDLAHLSTIGETSEGREIPLLVIADPPVHTAEQARGDDRMTVMLFGNIHAGEVCGKEALQMLARELIDEESDRHELLEDLIICLTPIYNADGNERFDEDNRPGQNGPDEMGQRPNAQGFDLNRDWIKMDAPETRAMIRFFNEWDPTMIVDTHTTNGSNHRYTLTYQGPKNPAGDTAVLEYVRDEMLPAVDRMAEAASDYEFHWYGNFSRNHTAWTTYPAEPRYGAPYRGIRNRISVLTEAYSYATFEDRVRATHEFCVQLLNYAQTNKAEMIELVEAADERTIAAGREPSGEDEVAIRHRVQPFGEKITVKGYNEYDDEGNRRQGVTRGWKGEPRDYEVEFFNNFVPTVSVPRPYAYVFPASHEHIAQALQRHGIEVEVLREEIEVDAEFYRLGEVSYAQRAYEGHEIVRNLQASRISGFERLEPDMYVVRTAQKLGNLAVFLLEPRSSDGLVTWNYFDDDLTPGERFPVLRVPTRTPMTLRSARSLPEDRVTGKRVTYDALYGSDRGARPQLSGSPVRVSWADDEHFYQNKDGEQRLVHAASGRSEPVGSVPDEVAERLAAHPAVTEKDSKAIVRRYFSAAPRPGDDINRGVVFEHADDLFYAERSGEGLVRLTADPLEEELWELSPDGQWVSFVKENDLFVVDVVTQTERAITTGGTDLFRNGKADWVYFEELLGRSWKTYWWSPDSSAIAYYVTDASDVPSFTIVNDVPDGQVVENTRYPKPGDPNPHVELRIASPAGGRPRVVDLTGYDRGAYLITAIDWTDAGDQLRVMIQDRAQTWLDWHVVGPEGGKPEKLFRETTEAWVEPTGEPYDLADGSFIYRSERDGWLHLYHFNKDGTIRNRITEGEFEVRNIHLIDEDSGWIYFDGTVDSHIANNFYRVQMSGGEIERLTYEPGSHRVSLSPDGSMFVDSWSSYEEPTKVALRTTDGGGLIRWIDTNPVYELEEYRLGEVEMVQIRSKEGVTLEGVIVYPPDFDPSKSYPVWFQTYGGPHAPTVRDDWSGGRLQQQLYANLGIVMFRGDPYPASGKGAQSTWTAYRQLGIREVADVAEMIEWIKTFDWVDGSRIGMDGWSYGGFMTGFAMTQTDLFAAGISGAPPTDWRDYDSIYTERYMNTPQNNPEGYDATSVVLSAEDLSGRLMLVHGAMDDNVHMQNSVRLIDALQDADKDFDFMYYPGARHGVRSGHRNRMYFDFITRWMEVDREPASEADDLIPAAGG